MKFIKWLINFIIKGLGDNLMVYAAQSAYYLSLSAIPFLLLLISVAQYFIPISQEDLIRVLPSLISPSLYSFAVEIIGEIFSKPTISLVSISTVTALWSASRGFAAMARGTYVIYKIPKRKLFITDTLLSLLYTIVFIAVLIASLGIIVFGNALISFINSHIQLIFIDITVLQYILLFMLMVLFFTIVYKSFAGKKIPFKYHLPGALFTGSGWILFSYIFSIYINNFANYPKIYGSLTAIVLLMLWLYFCMTIFLFGAEVNMEIFQKRVLSSADTDED